MLTAVPVAAQEAPAREKSGLQYSATLYLWGSSLDGSQSLFGLPPVDVDLRFGDILDKVDFAAAGIFEVQGDRFGFLGEMNYVKLSATAKAQVGPLEGDIESEAFFALAALTWRASSTERADVDLIGGLKYFHFDNAVALNPGSFGAADSASWIDATVGVKASVVLAPKWSLKAWAMVGGGGSDFSWDALAAVDYAITDDWSASFGLRAMGVDYSSDGFSYDMRQYGPILGVTRRF